MVVYVVGAIVLFAATGLLQIVKNFATANIGKGTSLVQLVDITKMYLG